MSEITRHLSEDELTLFHYGELVDRASAGRHLMGCSTCRGSYDELLAVLETVDSLTVPDRDAAFGARIWQRLQPELPARKPSSAARQRWAVAATLFLVLAAGYLVGRLAPGSGEVPSVADGGIPIEVRERILRAAVGEHLERSGRILVEIANDGDSLDVASLQEAAGGLLGANRLYRQTLSGAGRGEFQSLLEDLERVLLDITHSDAGGPSDTGDGLESIRARIEERGLLFKVRIVLSRLRQETGDEISTKSAERA